MRPKLEEALRKMREILPDVPVFTVTSEPPRSRQEANSPNRYFNVKTLDDVTKAAEDAMRRSAQTTVKK